jgi:hypothetical protein
MGIAMAKLKPLEVTPQLRAEHKAATERERAEIETAMWMRAPPGARRRVREKKLRREDWLADTLMLGRSHSPAIQRRLQLAGHGSAVTELWNRVEEDMPLSAAYSLAIDAKKTREPRESAEEAVARVLAEYDARPIVMHLADGKISRRHKATQLRPTPTPDSTKAQRKNGTGTIWTQLRELIGPYFEERLQGVEPAVVVSERQRFERDLQMLFETTQGRLTRARAQEQETLSQALSRRRFTEGCHVIKIDPPRGPSTAPWMKRAKSRFKSLAREYHPDLRGDTTRPQYEAVMKAWEAIESYHEHFGKKE